MADYSGLKQSSPAFVYREMLGQIDKVLALGQRSAGLWVKGDDGEHHLVQLWDPTWRASLEAMRKELESAIYHEMERERAATGT